MAITMDWPNKIIQVPKADLLLVQSTPTEIRELDLDSFRLELKSIEASVEGMPFLDTHSHSPPVTVGGVTLARVVEIINGYTVTFEDGQYAVNLAGANSNVGDVTNVNQVSVRSANSAGLTYSKEVEDQSFTDSRVWVDSVVGLPGTQFSRGTPGNPVGNIPDGELIIAARNLPLRLHLKGDFTIDSGVDLGDYDISSDSSKFTSLTFDGGNTQNLVIRGCELLGELNGSITANGGSAFTNLTNFVGQMIHCGLDGTIVLGDNNSGAERYEVIDCYSRIAGFSTPIFDCDNLDNVKLYLRRYSGGIRLTNLTGTNCEVSIDMDSGNAIIDSSCTSGDVVIRGTGKFTDNSASGCTVDAAGVTFGGSGLTSEESTQLASIDTLRKLMQNKMTTDPDTGLLTIYDDDDTTVFLQGNIYEDVLAAQLYRGRGIERRERLT